MDASDVGRVASIIQRSGQSPWQFHSALASFPSPSRLHSLGTAKFTILDTTGLLPDYYSTLTNSPQMS